MTTNQEGVHAAVRDITGTARSYNDDWHALFDADGIAAGTFNERMLGWINATLSASYTNLNEAMQAFAVEQGFANWASMNTFVAGSEASTFLRTYGPYGMVMSFADDASIAIDDETDALDFRSSGQVDGGALVGPGAKITYSAPSPKLTEQSDGFIKFQAHNLCLQSETFTNASWSKSGVASTSADTITVNSGSSGHFVFQNITAVSGATYTAEVELKAGTYRYVSLQVSDNVAHGVGRVLDLQTGLITADITLGTLYTIVGTPTVTDKGNGYYKLSITYTHGASGTTTVFAIFARPDGTSTTWSPTWSAVGTETFQVRKAHLRRTPSVDTYMATPTVLGATTAYDLPYVYSGGVRQGIMVEPAATNLMPVATPSSGHSNITWAGNTLETLDPAGTNTASKMTTTATAGTNIVDSATVTATSCTASVYIKATTSGLNRFALRNATTATILLDITISDFSTGSFSYNTGSAGASVEVLNNGWLRVVLSASAGITSGNSIQFYTGALGNSIAAGQVLYIWCRQLETGTVATSPIITYGAAVARAADLPSVSTAAFGYGAGGGTIFVEYALDAFVSNPRVVALDNGALTEIHLIDHTGGTVARAFTNDGGVNQALISGTVNALGTPNKVAYAWASNDFAFVCNGTVSGTDASGTLPTPTTLVLGSGAGTNPMTGSIVRVAYFSRRLSNAELQEITT